MLKQCMSTGTPFIVFFNMSFCEHLLFLKGCAHYTTNKYAQDNTPCHGPKVKNQVPFGTRQRFGRELLHVTSMFYVKIPLRQLVLTTQNICLLRD